MSDPDDYWRDFSHLNRHGHAAMVDVTAKAATHRVAFTSALVHADAAAISRLRGRGAATFGAARLAGFGAAKATSSLVPLCHPLPLVDITVDFATHLDRIEVRVMASTVGQTGVEMEALAAATAAALTLYEALRKDDPLVWIDEVTLWEKRGGRSGTWRRGDDGTVTNTPSDDTKTV